MDNNTEPQEIVVKRVTDEKEWETFVQDKSPAIFLQSWKWGQFQKELGRKIWYIGIYQKESPTSRSKLIGVCLTYLVPAKFRTYLYTSGGPIINWDKAEELLPLVTREITKIGIKNKAIFARFDPIILDTPENNQLLKNFGLQKTNIHPQAEHKWYLDITPEETQLLSDMKKNTRYAIKRAQKEGVTVYHSTNPKDFIKFWTLFKQTVDRQNFATHSKSYFKKQVSICSTSNNYRIYWATKNEKIIGSALIPFYGDTAVYLHAASSSEIKNTFPGYALIWQVIKDAKEAGLKYIDFWGIEPSTNPDIPDSGFTFFKKSFGGFDQKLVKAHDIPLSFRYILVKIFEFAKNNWKKFKKSQTE
ncbi:peptidoglycan bridge formation glycyltransferase FemA/FemB family protein [Candidatus Dojkabacteria bacterium]|nr:peptidoglycan bridge formation glycyltransferase FemA/FemB family protein [Candidatus Dojkabacteria bacterium]